MFFYYFIINFKEKFTNYITINKKVIKYINHYINEEYADLNLN